jgi:hypothetical protein
VAPNRPRSDLPSGVAQQLAEVLRLLNEAEDRTRVIFPGALREYARIGE